MRTCISRSGSLSQILHTDVNDAFRGAVELQQDVDPVLELVRKRRELHERAPSKEFVPKAEIPMVVYLQACNEGWANDPAAWRRWFNNPDNAAFRISDGRM